jgi:hypothetical protein
MPERVQSKDSLHKPKTLNVFLSEINKKSSKCRNHGEMRNAYRILVVKPNGKIITCGNHVQIMLNGS